MDVYKVERAGCTDGYGEAYQMIVIACDNMWAEKLARLRSDDFRKAKLFVSKMDLTQEGVISVSYTSY